MKPPYDVTDKILNLVASISEKLGEVNALHLHKPTTELRKKNRIQTIQSSLEIEGNTLSEEQITLLLHNKRVIAPAKDILEVQNAIKVYEQLVTYNAYSMHALKKAHKTLMQGLVKTPGQLRTKNVGIVKGSQVTHVAPGGTMVNGLMKDLFDYLKNDKDMPLIKSCVFHYELEFIHPFEDGNGRMGRLWQTLILMQRNQVFEYLPVEHLIKQNQAEYYNALGLSDKAGNSTLFIEYMLGIINSALKKLLQEKSTKLNSPDRIELFRDIAGKTTFSRKDYLAQYKEIGPATASRDLAWGVNNGILIKSGDKRLAEYKFSKIAG